MFGTRSFSQGLLTFTGINIQTITKYPPHIAAT